MSTQQVSSKNSVQQTKQPQKQKKKENAYQYEGLFKWLALIVAILAAPTFFNIGKFREHCLRINNYTVDLQYVGIWIVIGFVLNFFAKKFFKYLFSAFIRRNLGKYFLMHDQQFIQEKTILQTRQLYDTIFHFGISFFTWYSFYHESWFPTVIGGNGTCQAILSKMFYWPSASTKVIEALYAFQVGSILCHTFQHTVTLRKIYMKRNYYELLFHHIVTLSLESVSLFYNLIDVGIVIMILHDFSDGFRGINKVIKDSRLNQDETYSKHVKLLDHVYIAVWCLMRIVILPICALEAEVNTTWPSVQDMSYLFYQANYLRIMSILIICLQGYWLYYLTKYRTIQNIIEKNRRQFIQAQSKQKIEEKKEN